MPLLIMNVLLGLMRSLIVIIEHQVQVGDHSHISTGAIINGNTSIGSNTFVGSGAIIRTI